MMGNLRLSDDHAPADRLSTRSQVISTQESRPSAPVSYCSSAEQPPNVDCKQPRRDEAVVHSLQQQEEPGASTHAPPRTPPRADDIRQAFTKFEDTLLASTRKYTESPTKSPCKRPFLTKDSNTRGFVAFDVDERLIEVEQQFKSMKEMMNLSLNDRKGMEEAIEMAKTRGMDCSAPFVT